ncbi:MAG: DUF421 domain-containing protein [Acidobacteriota bacterium]|nr:DUF421 domain-containing protein [Acidobacteriota bacterium]
MESSGIFFDGWPKLLRALTLAILAYGALVILLRLSGKRTLSKMNVFDFVFVVALGSTLSQIILSPSVSLAEGVLALAALIGLQILLSWLCVQSHLMDRIINGEPALLLHRGKFLREAMKRERVTEEEMLAAARNQGLAALDEVNSIVLETDGTFSIVWRKVEGSSSSLRDVPGHPEEEPDEGSGKG